MVKFQHMSGILVMLIHQCMLGRPLRSETRLFLKHCLRATFRVFKLERQLTGKEDLPFLERVFQKLLLNFTWYGSHLSLFHILTWGQVGKSKGPGWQKCV